MEPAKWGQLLEVGLKLLPHIFWFSLSVLGKHFSVRNLSAVVRGLASVVFSGRAVGRAVYV